MGKQIDIWKYYERVRICCAFKDPVAYERTNIIDQVITLNQVLPEKYRLTEKDEKDILKIYRDYRLWILEKYMDPYFEFGSHYTDYLSGKYKKHAKAFMDIYRNTSDDALFLAQTLHDYLYQILYETTYNPDYEDADGNPTVFAIIAHRMYLATLLMFEKLGQSTNAINEQEWIDRYL